jgi:hypothetical protein
VRSPNHKSLLTRGFPFMLRDVILLSPPPRGRSLLKGVRGILAPRQAPMHLRAYLLLLVLGAPGASGFILRSTPRPRCVQVSLPPC